ncbi:hypothetical protein SAMN04487926_11974 [Paraburkholderia steynii]|uniref:Uncharacterized protein n=1 Tax=Paraburkholderia steynii TaxID=1245441 RepID=A0A7Z7FJE9_9BURK|nr:hypothetical protein SAMN04487926_11974 [Paraburkholderia steynii]
MNLCRHRDVIESDDRDVVRYAQASLAHSGDSAKRAEVICGKDGGWWICKLEQVRRCFKGFHLGEVTHGNEGGITGQAELDDRVVVGSATIPYPFNRFVAGYEGNAPMSQAGEMLDGKTSAPVIVNGNRRKTCQRSALIDENDRDVSCSQCVEIRRFSRKNGDDPVCELLKKINHASMSSPILVKDRVNQCFVANCTSRPANAEYQFTRKLIVEHRRDDPENAVTAAGKLLCAAIYDVADVGGNP